MNLTNIQFAQWKCNRFEKACDMFDEIATSHEHVTRFAIEQEITF